MKRLAQVLLVNEPGGWVWPGAGSARGGVWGWVWGGAPGLLLPIGQSGVILLHFHRPTKGTAIALTFESLYNIFGVLESFLPKNRF